jgi:L-asparaginase II
MSPYSGGVPMANVVRSGFLESVHRGSVAVVDPSGRLTAHVGDPYGPIFPRSSNKPLQATAMLRAGLRPADLPDPADLAVIAASHSGQPEHIMRIRRMLESAGLAEADLHCPPDLPLDEQARTDLLRSGGGRGRIYMNCSGKHTGMLLACRAAGWPTKNYVAPDHPLQVLCRDVVAEFAGEPVAAIGVDGCGAPVMAISLAGLARAFARLVEADDGTPERAVAEAMRARPELMSGTGRDDAVLMHAMPGLLSKGGAEGVLAVAVPGVGAVAMKIDDGAGRAWRPVVLAILGELGVDVAVPAESAQVPVLGGGEVVGSVTVRENILRRP